MTGSSISEIMSMMWSKGQTGRSSSKITMLIVKNRSNLRVLTKKNTILRSNRRIDSLSKKMSLRRRRRKLRNR